MSLKHALCRYAAVALFALVAANSTAAEKPNIVLILADDLGTGDVGWRGGEIKTPSLDRLAMAGARLESFYVQPVCSPTRAALMTGRYPMRHGLQVGVVRPWADWGLPLEERTLPQALKEAGYYTAICGKWHLGHFQPEYLPTRRGFDHQYGHYNGAIDYFTHIRDGGLDWHRDDRVSHDEGYSTKLIADEAVKTIRQHGGKQPLFLYVPFNAVHSPHQVPASYSDQYPQFSGDRKLYAGMLAAMDEAIGRIAAAIDEQGIHANTLFIFSSDNGGPAPGRVTSNGNLRAGKATLYEGGVRVAAFATWDGRIKAGSVVDEPLHIVDWYPTLLKLTGVSPAQSLPVDGKDIWATITAGRPSPHEDILLNTTPNNGAIRAGDWKLVLNGGLADYDQADGGNKKKKKKKAAARASVELFNLKNVISEKTNLAEQNPDKVRELKARLDAYAAQAVPPKSEPPSPGFKSPKVWGERD